MRLLTLKNPDPQPAPADEQLAFTTEAPSAAAARATAWAGAVWLTGDGNPTLLAAGPRELRLGSGSTVPLRRAFRWQRPDPTRSRPPI